MSIEAMFDNYDQLDESHGFEGEPLPTGWYGLEIEKIHAKDRSERGAMMVRYQARVYAGPAKLVDGNARCFLMRLLKAKEVNNDETRRTDAEIAAADNNIKAQMRGFMSSLGVPTATPTGADDLSKVCNFYNVDSWVGKQFVGKVKFVPEGQYPAKNDLSSFHNVGDEKRGIAFVHEQAAKAGNVAVDAQTL
jgi:hypothetical protein